MRSGVRLPFVSVILPIRNEVAYIKRSLRAVLMQDYPADSMEILTVDGMSRDGTREVIQKISSSQGKFPINLIDNLKLITPAALNTGIRHAKGDVIVRVDGHCEIAPDYVSRCVAHLLDGGLDGVGGSIETIGDTYLSRAIAIATSSTFGVGNSSFRTKSNEQLVTDSVPFPAYKRETIDLVGGYDEEMLCNEDDEYNYRILERGGKILLAADIKSRYSSRGSFSSLWRQYYRYGLWKVRVLQKHPHQMSLRQFVPPAFVLVLLLSMLASFIIPWGMWVIGGMAGTYLLFNLGASLVKAHKRDWRSLFVLPPIYAILHISYGLGFLVGLVRFINCWGDKQGRTPAFSSEDD